MRNQNGNYDLIFLRVDRVTWTHTSHSNLSIKSNKYWTAKQITMMMITRNIINRSPNIDHLIRKWLICCEIAIGWNTNLLIIVHDYLIIFLVINYCLTKHTKPPIKNIHLKYKIFNIILFFKSGHANCRFFL